MEDASAGTQPVDSAARRAEIAENLERVRAEVATAEQQAGREPGCVQLLPVTKFHPASDVARLAELGVTTVGENREQEARGKVEELAAQSVDIRFAMIGQIQTKKANAVARWASEVHSLDSIKLAAALNRGMELALDRGDRATAELPCLIQISFDDDADRGGVPRDGLDELVETVEGLKHVRLDGLMVVPPREVAPEGVFEASRSIADDVADQLSRPMLLSAGMSQDFAAAIACGSDIVRVGTRLLGARPVV